MAINLPNSPTNGQTVTLGNKTLVYSTSLSVWQIQSSPSGATVTTSDTAPTSPSDGDMWFDSATLNTFIYYADGSSNQWVKANPSGSTGPQGIQGVAGAAGADGADGASGGNGIATVVADMAGLIAMSGMSAGAQAYVTSNNKLYFYNGSGWYLIATVQNDAPSAITGVNGAYELAIDGTSTVITAVSTDPEGFPLTWSSSTSGLGSIATVGQGTGEGYAIASAAILSGTYAVTAYAGALTFKPDGTEMYYVSTNNDRVSRHTLSTAWDVSTASYVGSSPNTLSQVSNLTDVKFNNNGTKMYMADSGGTTDNTIYQYSLSTAWDPDTATYDNKSYDFSSVLTGDDLNCFVFNADGTAVYLAEHYPSSNIYQFTLSTAFDISTASYANKTLSLSSVASNGSVGRQYFQFTNDGSKLFLIHTFHPAGFVGKIYEYSLTTAYDISTASHTSVTYTPSGITTGRSALAFKPDGSKMFIMGTDNHTTISQFNLPVYADNQFVINPSTTEADAGTFTLTINATDGINGAVNASTDLSLNFIVTVANSRYTVMLAQAVGANNGTNSSLTDSSSNPHTIATVDGITAGTFSPYRSGGYSAYFDGTGDYLATTSSNYALGTSSAFTLEFWYYLDESRTHTLFDSFSSSYTSGNGEAKLAILVDGSNDGIYLYGGAEAGNILAHSRTFPVGVWEHFCWTRDTSGNHTFYINGTQIGTSTATPDIDINLLEFGRRGGSFNSTFMKGYLSDVRLVKGTVITPPSGGPTERLEAVTNTELLTCHLPYIADGSSNNHAITVNGDVSIKPFAPYDSEEYDAADHGGSIYFDGTSGNRAIVAHDASLNPTGAWTIECWFYLTDMTNFSSIFSKFDNGTSNRSYHLRINSDGTGRIIMSSAGSASDKGYTFTPTSGAFTTGQWYHFAQVYDGSGTYKYYVNGVAQTDYSWSGTPYAGSADFLIGTWANGGAYYGDLNKTYVSDLRLVIGTAVYSGASLTVPTEPLGNITNTKLLVKGTDASIRDKSGSTALTLVGDAKCSTTQVKFASSKSMYFDGAGDRITAHNLPEIGNSDFTFETWMYETLHDNNATFFDLRGVGGSGFNLESRSGNIRWGDGTLASGSSLSINTWYHIALCRQGSSTKIYINGTQTGPTYTDTNDYTYGAADRPIFGGNGYNLSAGHYKGYLQDIRLTIGLARYTANFTPPTASLEG